MKNIKMFTILVLGLMVWPASVAEGAQYLTVNGADVNSITLELGQSRTVEVVSTDGTSYLDYVGFDNGVVLGNFSHLETKPEAGSVANAVEHNEPAFYGYLCIAAGGPSSGIHFVFQYKALQLGETDLKLYDSTFTSVIDSIDVTVIPLQPIAMGTAFTYQGRLIDANDAADGLYDVQFRLFNRSDGGTQQGSTIDINDIDVIDGYFTAELDFGSGVFDGTAFWLEMAVRRGDSNDPNVFITLSPRQEMTPAPYALYAENCHLTTESDPTVLASVKDGIDWSEVSNRPSGLDDGDDVGLTSELDPQVGSNTINYIPKWNGSALVSGTIYDSNKVGIGTRSPTEILDVNGNINIDSVYKIGGATVLSVPDTNNTLVGIGAGKNNIGSLVTFIGRDAGYNNQGNSNTFLGFQAGFSNSTGYHNTFLGQSAGYFNTTGIGNTFLGGGTGQSNNTGGNNTFLGNGSGHSNTTGSANAFLGSYAGYSNKTGSGNVFIGQAAGYNETGSYKLYIANSLNDPPLVYGEFDTGKIGIGTMSPTATVDVNGTLALENGSSINEVSTDGTLADNSDLAIPTEKAVKTYVDSKVPGSGVGIVPVGTVVSWLKSLPNTPSLADNFVECNGQTLSDTESPFNGQTIPNLNGDNRFLRGSSTSGTTGGSETHTHTMPQNASAGVAGGDSASHDASTGATSTLPTYYEVVWIMRIK